MGNDSSKSLATSASKEMQSSFADVSESTSLIQSQSRGGQKANSDNSPTTATAAESSLHVQKSLMDFIRPQSQTALKRKQREMIACVHTMSPIKRNRHNTID